MSYEVLCAIARRAQKIYDYREESFSAKLATANKNPVGILAILNRHYQWNLPGVSKESSKQRVLSASELPKLGEIPQDGGENGGLIERNT